VRGGDESSGAQPDGVILLAGGQGRRLGGVDKAALTVGSRTLLGHALAAARGRVIVLVGPPREVPRGVRQTREDPPGGGPAAGVAAGLAALLPLLPEGLRPGAEHGAGSSARATPAVGDRAGVCAVPSVGLLVAVLAVDQPGVTAATLTRLARAVPADRRSGAVLISGGRRQYATGVFPAGVLATAVAGRASWHGAALRALIDPLVGAEVPAEGAEALDLDTPADLDRWRGHPPAGDVPP